MIITDLPNEILYQILLFVDPPVAPVLQQACRKFNGLVQPLLWRYHCEKQFKYWNPEHQIQEKLATDITKVDWKKLFQVRYEIDISTTHDFESILSSQVNRVKKAAKIVARGYDVKDTMLRHLNVADDAEDVLARRYYSSAVMGCLHRAMAVKEWNDLRNGQPVPLERALTGFDIFISQDHTLDFDQISRHLDRVAQTIRLESPELLDFSTRKQAIIIAQHLQRNCLAGTSEGNNYHALENNFISIALQDAHQQPLPLVAVVIYCSVARRLGVDAQPCCFPFHVYAIIKPPENCNLDGGAATTDMLAAQMYMDPFRSDEEVLESNLTAQLIDIGISPADHAQHLAPSSAVHIVCRHARNILNSIHLMHSAYDNNTATLSIHLEPDSALYSSLWALILLPGDDEAIIQREHCLHYLVRILEHHFSMDAPLVEQYVRPLDLLQILQLHEAIQAIWKGDAVAKQVKRRTSQACKNVKYQVGQIFRHKKYHYQGVITGWDVECALGESWISQMGVDQLKRGRYQSFYNVLVEDKSVRYVAEENIEVTDTQVSASLVALAGRHFKRWDQSTGSFISNIKDEYPDD
ncbi:MAG: hypothetical protein Q9167_000026 [Letrouitia subvulpina]